MRILIFGAGGMLGHKLYQRLRADFEALATIRSSFDSIRRFGIFEESSIIENIDVADAQTVERVIKTARPDCVINAVGVIKQVPAAADVLQTLEINSVFPNRLARFSGEYGFRLITISTDCVFDGKKGGYSESDVPNARDLYGISKLLGEVSGANLLTIRTSIIGRELATSHSILEWFLENRESSIKGYTNAIYSGFPAVVLADIISGIVADRPGLKGVYHISSDPISKFQLLNLFEKYYQSGVEIVPDDSFVIDRSLDSSKFRRETGFEPALWDEMIKRMAGDQTPYAAWRSQMK